MVSFDAAKFLSDPIYALDFGFMIGDVEDFLEFSEINMEWQFRREMSSIHRRTATEVFEPGYTEYLEASAEHRFNVSLPLRVRYAALVALTTSVEWATVLVVERLKVQLPERPKKANSTVHALRELDKRLDMGARELILDYEAIVRARDCIVHAAGLERQYKYRDELPPYLSRLHGIYLGNLHFLGKHICIDRGALTYFPHIADVISGNFRGPVSRGSRLLARRADRVPDAAAE